MKTLAWLNGLAIVAAYILVFKTTWPWAGYLVMVASILLVIWTTRELPRGQIWRLFFFMVLLGALILLAGKVPLLGGYFMLYGLAAVIAHFTGGSDGPKRG